MKAPVHGDLPTINSTQVMASTGLQDEGKVGWMDGVDGLVLTVFFVFYWLTYSVRMGVFTCITTKEKKSTMAAALLLKLRLSVRVLGVFSRAMEEKKSDSFEVTLKTPPGHALSDIKCSD